MLAWIDIWVQQYENNHGRLSGDTHLWMETVQSPVGPLIPCIRLPVPSRVWDPQENQHREVMVPPNPLLWHACPLGTHRAFTYEAELQMQVPPVPPAAAAEVAANADTATHDDPATSEERPLKRARLDAPQDSVHEDHVKDIPDLEVSAAAPVAGPIEYNEENAVAEGDDEAQVPAEAEAFAAELIENGEKNTSCEDDGIRWEDFLVPTVLDAPSPAEVSITEDDDIAQVASPTEVGEDTPSVDGDVVDVPSPSDSSTATAYGEAESSCGDKDQFAAAEEEPTKAFIDRHEEIAPHPTYAPEALFEDDMWAPGFEFDFQGLVGFLGDETFVGGELDAYGHAHADL